MSDPKKPPQRPPKHRASDTFEPLRTSLSPGPALPLPPQVSSLPSMPPLKVPPEEVASAVNPADAPASTPAPATDAPALGTPPVSLSALHVPARAPDIVVLPSLPEDRSLPPPPSLLPSLSPADPRRADPSARRRRIQLVVVLALLVGAAVLVGRSQFRRARRWLAGESAAGTFSTTFDERRFQRGNIHTHTSRSDGSQSPEDVAAWYRNHGYQFLAITDHDVLVDPSEIRGGEAPGFVLVPGEEISSSAGGKAVHVQALCIDHLIASGRFDSPLEALDSGIAAVRAQNGFAVINHPNFEWSLGLADIAPITGPYALEIWSGHPFAHSSGDATRPSHQAIWDELLTRGRRVTAVAVDDAHTLPGMGGAPDLFPGRAWVNTFGELGRASICDALRAGRFYSSSGVGLRRIRLEPERFTVWVDDASDAVEFLGSASQVLASVAGEALVRDGDGFAATYELRGGETYVRAVARGPGGTAAWTQPYYVNP